MSAVRVVDTLRYYIYISIKTSVKGGRPEICSTMIVFPVEASKNTVWKMLTSHHKINKQSKNRRNSKRLAKIMFRSDLRQKENNYKKMD